MDAAQIRAAERPARIIGVSIGLSLIAAAVVFLLVQKTGRIDARSLSADALKVGVMPFGLALTDAFRLPRGEEMVVYEVPGAAVEEPPHPPAKSPEKSPPATDDKPGGEREKFDWKKIAMGEAGRPPLSVTLVYHPASIGEAVIKKQFKSLEFGSIEKLGASGGLVAVDAGKLEWGEYSPDFVHERLYEAGGTFKDALRVNLSTPGRYCVLQIVWPRGYPGSKDAAKEILKTLNR